MKDYFTHLINGKYRSLLIALTLGPCSVEKLAKKSGMTPAETALTLQELADEGLIEKAGTSASHPLYQLDTALRKKLIRTGVRLSLSLLFALIGVMVKGLDKNFSKNQTQRLHHSLPDQYL
ncbi:hypothetical protein ACKQTC_02475 [Peptococcus simiae]|uniref:Uncharacterized protein n=1 Tax=Peptococcus simiae TaxID=1643805 RepID=A0ABW9GZK9_9FIRM